MQNLIILAWLTQRKDETLTDAVTWLVLFQAWLVVMASAFIIAMGG